MAVTQNGPATGFPNQGTGSGSAAFGPYADSTALQADKPAASQVSGAQALVGASAPYTVFAVVSGAWVATGASGGSITSSSITDSTAAGRSVLTAANAGAQRTALGLGTAATSATGDFAAASHSQSASTISDSTTAGRALLTAADAAAQRTSLGLGALATVTPGTGVATALAVNVGSAGAPVLLNGAGGTPSALVLTNATGLPNAAVIGLGTFATANAATPPAIGGTTPAAGTFSVLTASTELTVPSGAPGSPTARDLYAVADTLRYRDSTNTERLLLNATDNLSNIGSASTARSNLGAAASGAVGSTGITMSTARLLGRSTAGTGAVEEISVSGATLSGGVLTITGDGGSGTKTLAFFTPMTSQPPATAFATLDTRNSIAVLDFDDASVESTTFVGVIPEAAVLTSGITARIHWMATTATTGNCRWRVEFERAGTDNDADSYDTATEAHSAANGTSGIETVTGITATTIDSLVAGDRFRVRVSRVGNDATNDTMTGDAELIAVELRQVA